jgi:hypothetical protein
MRHNLFLSSLAAFLVLAGTVAVYPCKCVPGSLSSYYRRADAVVVATVTAVATDAEQTITTKLSITDNWKRALPTQIEVVTDKSSCGYNLEPNEKHLLYLKFMPSGQFSTMQCQGNLDFAKSQKARTWLKKNGKKGVTLTSSAFFPYLTEDRLLEIFEEPGCPQTPINS